MTTYEFLIITLVGVGSGEKVTAVNSVSARHLEESILKGFL